MRRTRTRSDRTEPQRSELDGDEETEFGTTASADAVDRTASDDNAVDGTVNDDVPTDGSADVENIKGIGPTYAERLAGIGIETVEELAAADAADVVEQTSVSEQRAARWIDRADAF